MSAENGRPADNETAAPEPAPTTAQAQIKGTPRRRRSVLDEIEADQRRCDAERAASGQPPRRRLSILDQIEAEDAAAKAAGETDDDEPDDDDKTITAKQVLRFVRTRYTLGVTPSGEPFAVPNEGARIPVMLGERGGRLRSVVTVGLYRSRREVAAPSTVETALAAVSALARESTEETTLHLRVARHGDGLVVDLAQPGSGACVLVTPGQRPEVLENPPEGVLFRRTAATRALPTPDLDGASLEPLRGLLGFDAADRRWLLCRGWLVAALLPDVPRPLVMAFGAPGSAKTTRAWLLANVLDPRQELGGAFGKNLGDDQAAAAGRYLLSWDNLTSASDAVADSVCRLVSGEEVSARRLYSDDEVRVTTFRRTGLLTAVSPPLLRSDAVERLVFVPLERISEEERRSETGLREAFTVAHPRILGGLLVAAAAMLAALPQARAARRARPRMADYADALAAQGEDYRAAYVAATSGAMAEAAEADPFVGAVVAWLEASGPVWSGTATEAHAAAGLHRLQSPDWQTSRTWWPANAGRFSRALTEASETLRAAGVTVERRTVRGQALLTITLGGAA